MILAIDYDSSYRLIEAQNYDGYKVRYEYTSGVDSKVSKSYEVFNDGTIGKALTINYGYNTTTFKDLQGRKEVYQFNNWGNTISIIDANGNGTYYKYGEISTANKLQSNSKLQTTVTNYLLNHNCEISNSQWNYDYWGSSQGKGEFTTEEKYLGNNSLKITKNNIDARSFFNQTIILEKGKTYTFSAYVKSKNILSALKKGAGIFVNYQNKDGSYSTIESEFLQGSSNWERLSVTFTLPSDAASNSVYLRAGVIEGTGIAYIDSLQVEDGITPNRYNLVENPSFKVNGNKASSIYWSAGGYDSSNALLISNDSTYPFNIDSSKTVYKMSGFSDKDKNVYQSIPVSGKKGDVFVAAGWSRGESIPITEDNNIYFSLYVGIQRTDGSYQWYDIPFNRDTDEWQYAADQVVADSDYKSITIYGLYYKNANNVYFDNFQLYKEEFGTSYQYDSKGNVVSTKDLAQKNSTFEYNGSSDLIKATDPKGNSYKYEYDGSRNVIKATSAENNVVSFGYDMDGIAVKSKICDESLSIESSLGVSDNGNSTKYYIDSSGDKTTTIYNDLKNTLDLTIDSKGNRKYNIYNESGILVKTKAYDYNEKIRDFENFLVNGQLIGDKGTRPIKETKSIIKSSDNTNVYITNSTDNLIYNLGLNKNSGTQSLRFKPSKEAYTRYLIYNIGKNREILCVYIGTDNKLKVATRKNDDAWNEILSTNETVKFDTNNFMALRWQNTKDGLKIILNLNDTKVETITKDFKDFTGGRTSIGAFIDGSYYSNSEISEFKYSDNNVSDNILKSELDLTKQNKKGYIENTIEVFPLEGNSAGLNGSKAIIDKSKVLENGNNIANYIVDSRELLYNLGIRSQGGNINLWFNTKEKDKIRYILYSRGLENGILIACINAQNKIEIALRSKAGIWKTVKTLDETIEVNKDYMLNLGWSGTNESINLTINLNDKKYTVATGDYIDFSGAKTHIGSVDGIYSLNGEVKQLIYSNNYIGDEKVNEIYKKGKGKYLKTISENGYTYENDRIKTINHNGFNYTFNYDKAGNNSEVLVGNQKLITNNYNLSTGNLDSSTYGNGHSVTYQYDKLDRLIGKKFNGDTENRYIYNYDANGNLALQKDNTTGISTRYLYDFSNRLSKVTDSNNNTFKLNYDLNNNVSDFEENYSNVNNFKTSYVYDKDNKLKEVNYTTDNVPKKIQLNYDTLGRVNKKSINTGSTTYNTSVTYVKGYAERETNLVSSYTNGSKEIQYSYDELKNIKSIVENGKTTTFTYNELNELVREDNGTLNKTITYEYDAGGNILSKKEYAYTTGTLGTAVKTINYSYGDANWRDKLTSYNGKAITYDAIGNPLIYDGYTYTWEGGRRLKAITGNNKNISYKYNDNGIRTEKTVNGVKTSYILSGDSVLLETTNDEKIHYTYDSSNNLVSMNIASGSNPSISGEYFYIRNLQGDIIGLIDKSGTEVVSYSYDTWGKLISIEGSLKDTVGVKNPYRYRGYRYDIETELYYLNARYYNAEWGRFINADGVLGAKGELLSHNLFAYCMNDPVNLQDPSGHIAISTLIMIGGLVAWGAGTIYSAVKQKQATGKVDWLHAVSYGASWGYTAMTLGLAAASVASIAPLATGSKSISPDKIRYSQSSVNGVNEITNSMKQNGWKGSPIDVVRMPDGKLTTIDNTRVLSARYAGIDVKANVHGFNDALPGNLIGRFTTSKGIPSTWGDAVSLRIGKQSAGYRNLYPNGSNIIGWSGN